MNEIRRSSFLRTFSYLVIALFLLSCNLTTVANRALAPSPTPVPTITVAPQTATLLPTTTDTVLPPTAVPPTAVPSATPVPPSATPVTPSATFPPPTVNPASYASPLYFRTGGTTGVVNGSLPAGGVYAYRVGAGQNQLMMVDVSSPGNNVVLGVAGATSGQILLGPGANQASWRGVLPMTQEYIISIYAKGGATTFTLQVTIPARISFAAGAISGSVSGQILGRDILTYLAGASAGQTMTASIVSPKNDVFLTIYGLNDGQPLVRSALGQTTWTGKLPLTQDYVIEAVNTGSTEEKITLKLVIQ